MDNFWVHADTNKWINWNSDEGWDFHTVSKYFHRNTYYKERKKVISQLRNLSGSNLTEWHKWIWSIMGQIKTICHLMGCSEMKQHPADTPAKMHNLNLIMRISHTSKLRDIPQNNWFIIFKNEYFWYCSGLIRE